jgi:hypothetical protein
MAHKEYGFQIVEKLIKELLPFAHPDNAPKLIGKGITVMLTPLPRNKRAKNPYEAERETLLASAEAESVRAEAETKADESATPLENPSNSSSEPQKPDKFGNNPFQGLSLDAK